MKAANRTASLRGDARWTRALLKHIRSGELWFEGEQPEAPMAHRRIDRNAHPDQRTRTRTRQAQQPTASQ